MLVGWLDGIIDVRLVIVGSLPQDDMALSFLTLQTVVFSRLSFESETAFHFDCLDPYSTMCDFSVSASKRQNGVREIARPSDV